MNLPCNAGRARAASARRHPRLLLPLGGGRGLSFSRPARPGRYLQLDYLHGTGDAQLGSRRTGDGRCARAAGGVVERAASASPHGSSSGVYACWSVTVSVRREPYVFSAANVRRTNILLISVPTTTRRPPTPDLRTTSRCLMSYMQPDRPPTPVLHPNRPYAVRHLRPTIGVRLAPHATRATAAGSHAHNTPSWRSAAVSTTTVERRGPSRREGSASTL